MVLSLDSMCQRGLHTVLWLHIGTLMHSLTAEQYSRTFIPFSVSLWNGLAIIIKKDWQCKAGRGRLPPYQSEDPSPTVPTYRGKKRKGNQLETKK